MFGVKRGCSLRPKRDAAKPRHAQVDASNELVGVVGLEPTASSSRTTRATNCATPRYGLTLPNVHTYGKGPTLCDRRFFPPSLREQTELLAQWR